MRVAIVHDWLVVYAGAERVLEQILKLFPQAELFSLVDFLDDHNRHFLGGRRAHTSFIQKLPMARKKYRTYLPLFPFAIQQFNFEDYDLVISSSYAVAKGIVTSPEQLHVCYCHSPVRYAWDLQEEYLRERGWERGLKGMLARIILFNLRSWDTNSANLVDFYASNSQFVAKRIKKYYRREAKIIYPPVSVHKFAPSETRDNFYLTASRMVPYKKIALIVEAFRSLPSRRLVVVGDGPEFKRVKELAANSPNIEVLGYQPNEVLRDLMQRARAFVFAAKEDFGIIAVEAQAAGAPVIAYGRGGVLESVTPLDQPNPTGVFFTQQTAEAIQLAVQKFEENINNFNAATCQNNAEQFSEKKFRDEFSAFVKDCIFKSGLTFPSTV
ncbi:glycosyltransferase family 4 protein [Radicibacter daui]|uniref:glycosyltransferase family 4 protein n=1 Tax=Radicibacter daui TaxID=3064829 RepID=UPI004046AC3C